MKASCFNCCFCSESYPSFIDACDKSGRCIEDVYTEKCADFTPSEVDE